MDLKTISTLKENICGPHIFRGAITIAFYKEYETYFN